MIWKTGVLVAAEKKGMISISKVSLASPMCQVLITNKPQDFEYLPLFSLKPDTTQAVLNEAFLNIVPGMSLRNVLAECLVLLKVFMGRGGG